MSKKVHSMTKSKTACCVENTLGLVMCLLWLSSELLLPKNLTVPTPPKPQRAQHEKLNEINIIS